MASSWLSWILNSTDDFCFFRVQLYHRGPYTVIETERDFHNFHYYLLVKFVALIFLYNCAKAFWKILKDEKKHQLLFPNVYFCSALRLRRLIFIKWNAERRRFLTPFIFLAYIWPPIRALTEIDVQCTEHRSPPQTFNPPKNSYGWLLDFYVACRQTTTTGSRTQV